MRIFNLQRDKFETNALCVISRQAFCTRDFWKIGPFNSFCELSKNQQHKMRTFLNCPHLQMLRINRLSDSSKRCSCQNKLSTQYRNDVESDLEMACLESRGQWHRDRRFRDAAGRGQTQTTRRRDCSIAIVSDLRRCGEVCSGRLTQHFTIRCRDCLILL